MSAHATAATHAAPKAKGASLKVKLGAALVVLMVVGVLASYVDWGSLHFHNPFASGGTSAPPPAPYTPPAPARPRVSRAQLKSEICAMCAELAPEFRDSLECAAKGCP